MAILCYDIWQLILHNSLESKVEDNFDVALEGVN